MKIWNAPSPWNLWWWKWSLHTLLWLSQQPRQVTWHFLLNNYLDIQTGRWGMCSTTVIRLLGTRSLLACRDRRAGHRPSEVDSNVKQGKRSQSLCTLLNQLLPGWCWPWCYPQIHVLLMNCFLVVRHPDSLAWSVETGVTCVPGREEKA